MRFPFFGSKDKAPAPPARPALGGDDALVQAARTRARQRLVGAVVLLVIGVVGFPLLFETQPRPLPVDTPILVPEGTPTRVTAPAPATRAVIAPPPDAGAEAPAASAPAASLPASAPAPLSAPAAAAAAVAATAASVAPAKPRAVASAAVAMPTKPASVPEPAAAAGRFVVQVGAYNDMERLKGARAKLEKLGYKSYTQDVETPTGKRTRVRVGPFGSKAEADAVAAKIKAAGMQAAILSL